MANSPCHATVADVQPSAKLAHVVSFTWLASPVQEHALQAALTIAPVPGLMGRACDPSRIATSWHRLQPSNVAHQAA